MRVLLVEDEERLARIVAKGLEREAISVDVAHDGTDGLWRAREGAYDVLVLDIMLPGMNGYEICRTLRAEEVWTPVLMLTAKDGEWDEAEALDVGADDFLRKPFSFVVLVARLRALARRGAPARPTVLRAGDLELDPATKRCTRGGETIELTGREYGLLEALLRARGAPLTKQQLIDKVWGMDFDGDPNVVEVYIRYLRRKVDRPYDRESITTIRGVGYSLNGDA